MPAGYTRRGLESEPDVGRLVTAIPAFHAREFYLEISPARALGFSRARLEASRVCNHHERMRNAEECCTIPRSPEHTIQSTVLT